MTVITNVSRRELFKGAAVASGLVLGLHVGFRKLPFAEAAETPTFKPNTFVSIDDTGLVTIVASRAEMGTGIKTNLPLVLADELEADWNRVKVVQAQGDPKYGDQNTDGSRSTWQFFAPMRVAGATARQMLETAAAQTWNVPAAECRAQNGFVVHAPSGRQLSFGDLAKLAAALPEHILRIEIELAQFRPLDAGIELGTDCAPGHVARHGQVVAGRRDQYRGRSVHLL